MPQELLELQKRGHEIKQFTPYHFRLDGCLDIFWAKGNRLKKYINLETREVGVITSMFFERYEAMGEIK